MSIPTVQLLDQFAWQQEFFDSLEEKPGHASDTPQIESNRKEKKHCLSFPGGKVLGHVNAQLFHENLRLNHREKIIAVARNILQEEVPELNECEDLCVTFTGSDGREEKLSRFSSPIELLIFVRKTTPLTSGIVDKLRSLIAWNSNLFYQDIELKSLRSDSLLTYAGPKGERPFPTRSLDALFIIGSQNVFNDSQKAFFAELQNPENGKKLNSFKKQTVHATHQVFNKVMNRSDVTQIDLATGQVCYDGKRIKGVKYPFLRAFQYTLAMHVFKLVKAKKIQESEFLTMPHAIIDRIQWLADKKFLEVTPEEVKEFKKAYATTLIWSGISQKNFEIDQQITTVFPSDEVTAVAQSIAKFYEILAA